MKTKEELKIYKRDWARKYRESHKGKYRRGEHPNSKKGNKKGHTHKNIGCHCGAPKGVHNSLKTEFKKLDIRLIGINSNNWKGENAGYVAKHNWMRQWYGVPKLCEHCKKVNCKRYDWANISGKYLRNRKDWLRLCSSCHKIYDLKKIKNRISGSNKEF